MWDRAPLPRLALRVRNSSGWWLRVPGTWLAVWSPEEGLLTKQQLKRTVQEQIADVARRSGVPLVRVAEEHEERSAIREYLGGLPREEAEVAAVGDTCDVLGVPR